jgi:hypothetical protein
MTQKEAADGSVFSELLDRVIYLVSDDNRFASRVGCGLLKFQDDHPSARVTLFADPMRATLNEVNSRRS